MHFRSICKAALILLFIAGSSSVKSQTLVWSDEFNLPNLDREKWTTEVGGHGFGNGELQYYTSGESNIFIGSKTNPSDTGYLVIEARRENYGVAPENRQFTSGRLNTAGKFDFKYGTIEARIKLPDLQNGLWPAFWMLGANYPTVGWPRSGEIDILEAGFRDDWQQGVANQKVNTTVHWFQDNYLELVPNAHEVGWWGNASASQSTLVPENLNDDFHLFKLTWTPTEIRGYVDGAHFYTFAVPETDPNITEFSHPFFVILNLAVGGSNFVGITDPAQITAPMPAQMVVDYVRVYADENTETFVAQNLPRESGKFGVFTETTEVTNSLGDPPTIEVWSNLVNAPSDAPEGSSVLSFTANPGNWFGMGIPTGSGNVKNMQNFIDGHLRFHMKTTSNWPMSIGIISTANGNAQPGTQSKAVRLDPAGNQYGLVRDGEWHEVAIPFSAFGNVEFRSINTMFYLVGDNPSSPVTFAIDNIYWSDGTKITPENGDFVIYSDTKAAVDTFNLGSDGRFFVWEATLNQSPTSPLEGTNVLSFTHNNKGWFGAAFTADAMYNLTGFQNTDAKLVFSLKTSDTVTPFHIGMKSGTRDGEGQKWIAFTPGQTPYGFQRNGTWQTVEIPMSDFYDAVNLMEVTQLFQIIGTGNISDIAIDNIYLTGGSTALPDVGSNAIPVVNAGTKLTVRPPADSLTISATANDADGSIVARSWTLRNGPNTPFLSGDTTSSLTVTGLIDGVYVFRFTATDDNGATGFDDVTVFVGPNLPPTATAADRSVSLPIASVVLTGTASDVDGAIANVLWTFVSGPNTPALAGDSTVSVTVTDVEEGTYTLLFSAVDNEGAQVQDTVLLLVAPNSPPVANAGDDVAVTLPENSVTITGAADDSGSISSYLWQVLSGPSTPDLAGENSASVVVSNLVEGAYVLLFSVTDNGGLSSSDTVNVTVNPAPVNIALMKPVTASSVENPGTPASFAVDGNPGTRWASAFSDPQWIYVDLGESFNIDAVKITWEAAMARDYQLDFSEDAQTWTTVKTVVANSSVVNQHTDVTGSGRYVRIFGTSRATPYGYSIFELEVFGTSTAPQGMPVANAGPDKTLFLPDNSVTLNGSGTDANGTIVSYNWSVVSGPNTPALSGSTTPNVTLNNLVQGTYTLNFSVVDNDSLVANDEVMVIVNPRSNLALNRPVMFSSAESDGTLGAQAVDGNLATRWSSAFFDPQWIYVDLGDAYSIDQVKITWEGAFGKDYMIQLSDDASNWTTIKTVVGNTTLVNDHTDVSGAGRYVRIFGTARATPWGYSIFELEVYGGSNTAPTAYAGEDVVIHLPENSLELQGVGNDSDGAIAAYGWSVESGPNSPTISNADSATVFVTDLIAGTYLFRLTVTDNNGATASDEVIVIVNTPPTADAGTDVTLTFPADSVVLPGNAYDEDGSVVEYEWVLQSGPNSPTLEDDSTINLTVTDLIVGTYVFNLTVKDNYGASASDVVIVKVNVAPTAYAGDDVLIQLPDDDILLSGSAMDNDGSITSIAWEFVSGPSTPTTTSSDSTTLQVSGLIEGIYVFSFTTTDNDGASSFDEVAVTVIPNTPPVVNAGADIEVTLPVNEVTLIASTTDSLGFISQYLWIVKQSPTAPILEGTGSDTLTASGLIAGIYVFEISVTDNGGLTASDEVTVVVHHDESVNIALNKPVQASSDQGATDVYAVDGNENTGWNSNVRKLRKEWVEVDLLGYYFIANVKVLWGEDMAKHYDIEVSLNGENWWPIKSVKANRKELNDFSVKGFARFIRVEVSQSWSKNNVALHELEVYGRWLGPIYDHARMQMDQDQFNDDENEIETEISFFPNPAKDVINVIGLEEGSEVKIISATGTKTFIKIVRSQSVDLSDIPSGLYIVDCLNGVRKKIVKE